MIQAARDLRLILASGVGEPVVLTDSGGATVYAVPSLASVEDTLGGEAIIAGRTKALRFATADVPSLVTGHRLTWGGTTYRANFVKLAAMGHMTVAFLGTV